MLALAVQPILIDAATVHELTVHRVDHLVLGVGHLAVGIDHRHHGGELLVVLRARQQCLEVRRAGALDQLGQVPHAWEVVVAQVADLQTR